MPVYQHGFGTVAFTERAAEVQPTEHATLERFRSFAEASGSGLESVHYANTLSDSFFGDFLRLTHFTFEGREALKEKPSRALWDSIISRGDEKRDKRERGAGRA